MKLYDNQLKKVVDECFIVNDFILGSLTDEYSDYQKEYYIEYLKHGFSTEDLEPINIRCTIKDKESTHKLVKDELSQWGIQVPSQFIESFSDGDYLTYKFICDTYDDVRIIALVLVLRGLRYFKFYADSINIEGKEYKILYFKIKIKG